ncbi:uncharacterized protein MELLADRAFT_96069 [Melampsora larici-populina 98AG31]|uniref:Uncharacterized protein n=1 Tax=Melampsora larici-populina (strain 98AG31 / pathotype 3-4-7) TaxID=747676 RepID=F4SAU8_MELLP|nr:uncharacterized protein MELLADRAFT_96069 [Melampsora larici-populina 98AG31]EGF98228.1 hypothetical protein MELLADRAFT_96069 [Melampsora larici-populina 98AG31]
MAGSGTQEEPQNTSDERNKRRKRNDDETNDKPDLTDEEESDADEGLSFEEKVARRKKKEALRKKQKAKRVQTAMVSNLAAGSTIPSAATSLSRALHEWIRFMMGIVRKSKSIKDSDLPPSPSNEERKQWMDRKEEREATITKAINRALRRYNAKQLKKNPDFKANPTQLLTVEKDAAAEEMLSNPMKAVKFTSTLSFVSRVKYTHLWGKKCEGALALAGFPRCTFDWEAGYDTPWNSTMSSILIQQWMKCYKGNGVRGFGISASDNTPENQDEVVRRWFLNQRGNYREQLRVQELLQTPAGELQVQTNKADAKIKASKKRAHSKIHAARLAFVEEVFDSKSPEAEIISYIEVHSEDEVKDNGTRERTRKPWRSAQLDAFIEMIDKCMDKIEVIPKKIKAAKHTVDRGAYSPNVDTDSRPPKGFQRSLVSPTWLNEANRLTVSRLELCTTDKCRMERTLQQMMRMMQSVAESSSAAGPSGTAAS